MRSTYMTCTYRHRRRPGEDFMDQLIKIFQLLDLDFVKDFCHCVLRVATRHEREETALQTRFDTHVTLFVY